MGLTQPLLNKKKTEKKHKRKLKGSEPDAKKSLLKKKDSTIGVKKLVNSMI